MANTKKPTKEGSGRKTADDSAKLERLRELVSILEGSNTLSALEYEDADIVVRLSRGGSSPAPLFAHVAPAAGPMPSLTALSASVTSATGNGAPALAAPSDDKVEVVKSPFVGTFYRSPSPNAKVFTDVGQRVQPKQVLCIIEAMKLMNEIECEVSGQVVEILPANGQPVQYGDPLFKIAVDK